jgi:hypothetical protein
MAPHYKTTSAPRRQCAKCPWKKSTNPHDIPTYDPRKHARLSNTITEPESLHNLGGSIHMMACHETKKLPCVGWLLHQLGPGNNLVLRLRATFGKLDVNVKTIGPQHACFEDTLPTKKRKKREA